MQFVPMDLKIQGN